MVDFGNIDPQTCQSPIGPAIVEKQLLHEWRLSGSAKSPLNDWGESGMAETGG